MVNRQTIAESKTLKMQRKERKVSNGISSQHGLQIKKERSLLIKDFNDKAQESFVRGETPTVLKASTSRGFSKYHHELSARINTGFRIQAFYR